MHADWAALIFIFVALLLHTAGAHSERSNDDIYPDGILLSGRDGVRYVNLTSDTSSVLLPEQAHLVITGRNPLQELVHMNLTGFEKEVKFLEIPLEECIKEDSCSMYWFTPPAIDVELDWIAGNLYISTGCGTIYACKLGSTLCGIIRNSERTLSASMRIFPQKRVIFWCESNSIIRAGMDGWSNRSIYVKHKTAINAENSQAFTSLSIEFESSYLYWTISGTKGIERCDIDGNNWERLSLATASHPHVITVAQNLIYWVEKDYVYHKAVIMAAKVGGPNFLNNTLTMLRTLLHDARQVLVVGNHQVEPDGMSNPCEDHNCTQICTLSEMSTKGMRCLCRTGLSMLPDQTTRVDHQLVVSTGEGIIQLTLTNPMLNLSQHGSMVKDGVTGSTPGIVACYSVRSKIFWAEEGKDGTTRVHRLNIAGSPTSELVWLQERTLRRGVYTGMQALAVDWLTGNLYAAFRNHRRIYACDPERHSCAELLGNQVASDVAGIALHPIQGMMFWTERDPNNFVIMRAKLNGGDMGYVRKTGVNQPGEIAIDSAEGRVYWAAVDMSSQENIIEGTDFDGGVYRSLAILSKRVGPLHIGIFGGDLYYSSMKDGTNESMITKLRIARGYFFAGHPAADMKVGFGVNVSTVNGLAIFHNGREMLEAQMNLGSRKEDCPGL